MAHRISPGCYVAALAREATLACRRSGASAQGPRKAGALVASSGEEKPETVEFARGGKRAAFVEVARGSGYGVAVACGGP